MATRSLADVAVARLAFGEPLAICPGEGRGWRGVRVGGESGWRRDAVRAPRRPFRIALKRPVHAKQKPLN